MRFALQVALLGKSDKQIDQACLFFLRLGLATSTYVIGHDLHTHPFCLHMCGSGTSTEIHINLPVATAIIILFYWLSTRLVLSDSAKESPSARTRRYRKFHKPVGCDYYYKEKTRDPPDRDAWKKSVNAPIVESAWESFCGSIIQEWIYDSWFAMISPDREFPAEIRRLLNEAFAEVAQRARRIDLRTLLLRSSHSLTLSETMITDHLHIQGHVRSLYGATGTVSGYEIGSGYSE